MIKVRVGVSMNDLSPTRAMQQWLLDRDYLPMSSYDMRRMFYPFQNHHYGSMPIEDVWRLCSHAVVYDPQVDPMTFEPNRLIWWFPPWAGNDAMIFKLMFAGS